MRGINVKRARSVLLLAFAVFLGGCATAVLSGPGGGGPQPFTLAVSPATAALPGLTTQQFTATASDGSHPALTWSVNGVAGAESANSPFTDAWVDSYMRGVLYGTFKLIPGTEKLDVLLGACDGVDHTFDFKTKDPSPTFHSMGWFATCRDTQGNEFGLWQNDPSAPAPTA